MIELLLEEPAEPQKLLVAGIEIQVDASMVELLHDQRIVRDEDILYIEYRKHYVKENAFSRNQRCMRQRLDIYVYETMNAYGRTINIHRQRLILCDGNPYNLTIENMRVERLSVKLSARRQIA